MLWKVYNKKDITKAYLAKVTNTKGLKRTINDR